MADQDGPDPQFDAMTSRLLRREALRRAAEEMNSTSGPGLKAFWRASAEVTAEARAGPLLPEPQPTVTLRIRWRCRRARQKPEKPLLSAGHLRDAGFAPRAEVTLA